MGVNEYDPRVLRTRELFQTALLSLMKENSFQFISVSDIAKRAKLNRATFYLHYLDKFDLLAKTARDTFIATINENLPDWNTFQVEDIRYLTQATCDYVAGFLKDCSPANKPYEPLIEAEIQRVLYDYVYCWLNGTLGNPQYTLPIETSAMVVSASVMHMSLKWSRGETIYSREQVIEEVYGAVTHGILQMVAVKPS